MASFSDADAAAIRSQIETYAKTALAADWDASELPTNHGP
jgi:hypothetical protein